MSAASSPPAREATHPREITPLQWKSGIAAWLGPAIGPSAFEVGGEVRDAFVAADAAAAHAFVPGHAGKWLADLHALARQRLARAGVEQVSGMRACTFSDARRYFSYRRDGATGRMGAFIWRTAA